MMACSQGQEKGADYKLASESTLTEAQKGQVVAQIGKKLITLEDFEAQLNEKSPFVRARYNSASRKREFLDSLVRFELLAHAAEEKATEKIRMLFSPKSRRWSVASLRRKSRNS